MWRKAWNRIRALLFSRVTARQPARCGSGSRLVSPRCAGSNLQIACRRIEFHVTDDANRLNTDAPWVLPYDPPCILGSIIGPFF